VVKEDGQGLKPAKTKLSRPSLKNKLKGVAHAFGSSHLGGGDRRVIVPDGSWQKCETLSEKLKELGAWLKW
jgi:hypothetical protein